MAREGMTSSALPDDVETLKQLLIEKNALIAEKDAVICDKEATICGKDTRLAHRAGSASDIPWR